MKDCLWTLAHGRSLTNEARWRKGLADSAMFARCGDILEDTMHVLSECPYAREIWSVFRPEEKVRNFYTT